MCGIVGSFGYTLRFDTFEYMLKLDTIRGEDSTGVLSLVDNIPKIAKEIGTGFDMIWNHDYLAMKYNKVNEKKYNLANPKMLVGHNRAATIGKINIDNAHPFNHEHIYMVHNGTINNFHIEGHSNFETDSEFICYMLSKYSVDDVWSNFTGAAVLVWWNEKDKSLNFITNEQRPFHFAHTISNNTIYFSSDKWILDLTANKFNLKWNKEGIRKPLKNILFTFKLDKGQLKVETRKLEEQKEIVKNYGFKYPWYDYYDKKEEDENYPFLLGYGDQSQSIKESREKNHCIACREHEDNIPNVETKPPILLKGGQIICQDCFVIAKKHGQTIDSIEAVL